MAGDARERPITFSASEVRAILDGRKTQTRRIAKITAIMGNRVSVGPHEELVELDDGEFSRGVMHYRSTNALSGPYPIGYAVGDRAWVITIRPISFGRGKYGVGDDGHLYDIRGPLPKRRAVRLAPPRNRRADFSRLTLLIEDVRVQRLQDISEEDARAEGCGWCETGRADDNDLLVGEPIPTFSRLWSRIHGPDAWDRNPWVVALTFRRIAGDHHG